MITRGLRLGAVVLYVLLASEAWAHGSVSMEDDTCKLRVGRYIMHFTGYQPETPSGPKEFCEDIPEVANTVIVLDYLNEELRDLPAEVRIIRDTGSMENLDAITVLHVPPALHPSGSLSLEAKFSEAGKYVGLVTVGDKEKAVARFPFSVGRQSAIWHWLVLAAAAAGGLYFVGIRQRKKQRASG